MSYVDKIKLKEQPPLAELYTFTTVTGDVYRMTSFEKSITFQSEEYTPQPIARGDLKVDESLNGQTIEIRAPLAVPFLGYIANTPVEPVKVKIVRVFTDDFLDFIQLFTGELITITIINGVAIATFKTISKIFKYRLPNIVHQAFCNHRLFDEGCGLDPDIYVVPAIISISGNTLISGSFSIPDVEGVPYFALGHVITEYGDMRLITNHVGNTITLQSPFDTRLHDTNQVFAFPGCDKRAQTCITKYSNFDIVGGKGFLGFPHVPSNNPVVFGI